MKDELLNLLIGFLTKSLNKSDSEVKKIILNDKEDALTDNALQMLIDLDINRVNKLKTQSTDKFNDGHKKGLKEGAEKMEAYLRTAFPEIDADKTGEDLVTEIKTEVEKKATGKSKLTDDQVKTHPLFLQREKELKKDKEDAVKAAKDEYENFKKDTDKRARIDRVKAKVNEIFASKNPILPKEQQRAENQKKLFLQTFDSFDYQIEEDGTIIIMENGNRKDTPNGHPVNFEDFVTEKITSLYDLSQQPPTPGTGNKDKKTPDGKPAPAGTINMNPKNDSEFFDAMLALEKEGTEEANKKIIELSNNFEATKAAAK